MEKMSCTWLKGVSRNCSTLVWKRNVGLFYVAFNFKNNVYHGPYGWDDKTGKPIEGKPIVSPNVEDQVVFKAEAPTLENELAELKLNVQADVSKPLIQEVSATPLIQEVSTTNIEHAPENHSMTEKLPKLEQENAHHTADRTGGEPLIKDVSTKSFGAGQPQYTLQRLQDAYQLVIPLPSNVIRLI